MSTANIFIAFQFLALAYAVASFFFPDQSQGSHVLFFCVLIGGVSVVAGRSLDKLSQRVETLEQQLGHSPDHTEHDATPN